MPLNWDETRTTVRECIKPYIRDQFGLGDRFHWGMKPSASINGYAGLGIHDWANWASPHVLKISKKVRGKYANAVLDHMVIGEASYTNTLSELADMLTKAVIESPSNRGWFASLKDKLGFGQAA